MAVSGGAYLRSFHDQVVGLGETAISSDFYFEIEGFESLALITKQAPWPVLTPAGEIEIATPLGSAINKPQQAKTYQSGAIAFYETIAGTVDDALLNILSNGGVFNAKVYEGTPEKFTSAKRLHDCFLQMDNPDRDFENRSQALIFNGTLFFHYFGEKLPGNSNTV